jgi:phenylalanyl-tRNA synthetase beta chain
MLFGGLETIQRNSNRQRPDLRLFEFGNVYQLLPATDQGNPLSKYNEQFMLALWVTGRKHDPSWNASGESTGFFEIKAFVENILVKLGFDVGKILAAPITGKDDIFSEGISYKAQSNLLAELVRTKSGKFELKNEVYFAVLHWDTLLSLRGDLKLTFRELLRFPEVRRDLALLLDRSVTFAQVRDLAHRTEGKLLKKVGIFDVYEGEQVAKGKKSYAVSFVLQDSQATLTNERIEKVMKRLMQAFSEELKAEIR